LKKLIIILFFITSAISYSHIFDYLTDMSVRLGAYYNSKNMKGAYFELCLFENHLESFERSFQNTSSIEAINFLLYNDFQTTRLGFSFLNFKNYDIKIINSYKPDNYDIKFLSSEITDISREHIFFDGNLFWDLMNIKNYYNDYVRFYIGPTFSYKHIDYNHNFLNKYIKGFEIGIESKNKIKFKKFNIIAGFEHTRILNTSRFFFHSKLNINASIVFIADTWIWWCFDCPDYIHRKLYLTLRYDKNFLIDENINYDKINFEINL
jgi:hypothetical protein